MYYVKMQMDYSTIEQIFPSKIEASLFIARMSNEYNAKVEVFLPYKE